MDRARKLYRRHVSIHPPSILHPPTTSLAPIDKAALYLTSVYNPTLRLCIEFPKTIPTRCWTASDNLWAYYALLPYDPTIAEAIKDLLQELVITYGLPHDADGLPISYKHEVIGGTWQDITLPFTLNRQIQLKSSEGFTIYADLQNSKKDWPDSEQFADILCYTSLTYHYRGNSSEADHYYEKAVDLWDGLGIADTVFHDHGVYETYKLALLLHNAKVLGRILPFERDLSDRICSLQNSYTGGIYVNYYPDGRPIEDTNTETITRVIITQADPPPAS